MAEVVPAFVWAEHSADRADCVREIMECHGADALEVGLELRECHFDWVEFRAVGRKEEEPAPRAA